MRKKITNLDDYVTAGEGARLVSERLGRPIRRDYMFRLATRTKKPAIDCIQVGNRRLYKRAHLEMVQIKEHTHKNDKGNDAA